MLYGLFTAALVSTFYQGVKDAFTMPIPAEKWANKDLIYKDIVEGNGDKLGKNARNGKYIVTKQYPEPHKDSKTRKIIIENEPLYEKDCLEYGVHQARKWMKQGKYNLTPEEFKKEEERIQKEYAYLYRL